MARPKKALKRADGEGTITARRNSKGEVIGWKAAVTVGYKADGKPDRRWVSAPSQEAVRRKAETLKSQRDNGTLPNTEGMTIEEYGRFWLENKPKAIRNTTRASYAETLENHFYKSLGRVKLEKLSAADLDGLYRAMLSKGLSTRLVRYVHTLAHGMLEQAVKWGKLPRNVADAATAPALKTKKMQVWQPAEAARFLEHSQLDRLRAAWYLGLFAGLRCGELLGLRWIDLDLKKAELSVNQVLAEVGSKLEFGEPKTASSKRTISISLDTVAVLLEHLERQNQERSQCGDNWHETGLVLTSTVGTPLDPNNLRRSYRAVTKLAGVPMIRLHDLRHTSASLAIRRGDNPKVVSERLGHTNVAFTLNTYVKTFADQRREAALGIADLFPRADSSHN